MPTLWWFLHLPAWQDRCQDTLAVWAESSRNAKTAASARTAAARLRQPLPARTSRVFLQSVRRRRHLAARRWEGVLRRVDVLRRPTQVPARPLHAHVQGLRGVPSLPAQPHQAPVPGLRRHRRVRARPPQALVRARAHGPGGRARGVIPAHCARARRGAVPLATSSSRPRPLPPPFLLPSPPSSRQRPAARTPLPGRFRRLTARRAASPGAGVQGLPPVHRAGAGAARRRRRRPAATGR